MEVVSTNPGKDTVGSTYDAAADKEKTKMLVENIQTQTKERMNMVGVRGRKKLAQELGQSSDPYATLTQLGSSWGLSASLSLPKIDPLLQFMDALGLSRSSVNDALLSGECL